MVEKDKYLVVVSVLEGRKFPKRARHQLIVEARFDGELLATDPVDHVENPDFTQELAWELDKKGLHQHRLQRTSIKVQVYAFDSQSTVKEPVGYVVLDLRSAQSQQTSKWMNLLHGKYSRNKPELKLGIYLDEDKGPEQSSFKAREAPPRTGKAPPAPSETIWDPKELKPVLNDTEGFYQIGPADQCTEQFILSVTIAFAANLPQLIPASVPLPPTADGYFFYYSLFGNDVTNEPFQDLLNPNFPPERASVKLRSSVSALFQFFVSQPGLEVHLCCGDQSLGSSMVPLASLIQQGSTEIYMKPVNLEGAYQLNPPNRLKDQMAPIPEDMKPSVGVSIALRKDDQTASNPGTPLKEHLGSPSISPVRPEPKSPARGRSDLKSPPPQNTKAKQPSPSHLKEKKEKKKQPGKKLTSPPPRLPSPPAPPTHDGSYTDTFDTGDKTDDNVPSLRDELHRGELKGQQRTGGGSQPSVPSHTREGPAIPSRSPVFLPPAPVMPVLALDGRQVEGAAALYHPLGSEQSHHFCFSVDLRSVRILEISHVAYVFARYTYPFFGSAAPVLTHPPVDVRKGMEVLLPQSFCSFNFATTIQKLADTFNRVPLLVELWDRDKQKAQTTLLGAVQLPLAQVMAQERARAVHTSGVAGWRQMWNGVIPIVASEGDPGHIAEMQVMLSLEDWGPTAAPKPVMLQDGSTVASTSESAPVASPPKEPRETLEYQAAMELELWKEEQEKMFELQLKEKEQKYMKALSEEWMKRDRDREVLTKKKIAEYHQLEEKLHKAVNDLTRREKQLAANEQEVMRLRADLHREHERKMIEMREASHRMKEDCDHQVQLEKTKTRELEDYILRLKNQASEWETKCQLLDKDFTAFKEQQNSKPEVRLQSEINLLTLEKVELERKMDAVTKSKVHYKQQWGRALKELARLKQREQAAARAQLKRQQQELEHMRLRYLAAEEKEVVKSEKKQLEDIRQELQQLKEQEASKSQQSDSGPNSSSLQVPPPDPDTPEEDHITRLIEERDTLLRTGVYTSEDRIIAELDRQIREAIERRGR